LASVQADQNLFFNPERLSVFTEIKIRMPDDDKKLKRLTIDLTDEEHRTLKGFAAEAGVSMRDLVLQTLRREGLLSRTKRGPHPAK